MAAPSQALPRILFLVQALNLGGSERQLFQLAVGLAQQGWPVAVTSLYSGPLAAELQAAAIPVTILDKRGKKDLPRILRLLWHQVRDGHFSLVHGYLTDANLLALVLGLLLPHLKVVCGLRSAQVPLSRTNRWLLRLTALLSRRANLIIANSRSGCDYHISQGFPGSRMVVIPNGIDTDHFHPDPRLRQQQRLAWNLAPDVPLVGLVARLDPLKDHPTFLHAAALLLQQRPGVRFVCVGDGPADYRQSLERLAEHLGLATCLRWTGTLTDPCPCYNAMDLAVSASITEGFSNTVAEAMACGTPCVVTEVGDSPLIVGPTGGIISPGDPAALAAAMDRLLDQPVPQAGMLARQRILDHFSLAALIQKSAMALHAI